MVKGFKFNLKNNAKKWGCFPNTQWLPRMTFDVRLQLIFFGKIPTPILMKMTGHTREATFISYIGQDPNKDAVADRFMEGVKRINEQQNIV